MANQLLLDEEEFWRQMEHLSMLYISRRIKPDINHKEELTRETKDGGYDGKFVIDVTVDGSVRHTIMMEAKYRTTIKSLSLQDCSKALIIAFNRAINTLYLITNVGFSPQAEAETRSFAEKINLYIVRVNGKMLNEFITEEDLRNQSIFSQDFFNSILNDDERQGIPCLDITVKRNEENRCQEKKLGLGSRREQSSAGKVIVENEQFKLLNDEVLGMLLQKNNYFLLEGMAGVGKTIFLTTLLQKAQKRDWTAFCIDLQQCTSPRILFIKILESLWGGELSHVVAGTESDSLRQEIETLVGYTADGKLDERVIKAVTQAICLDQTVYTSHMDTYSFFLTEFLHKILIPYQSNNRFILAFVNLNKAETDTLNFLYAVLCKVVSLLNIIVEIRLPFILETESENRSSAKTYYQKLTCISHEARHLKISQFDESTALEFLRLHKVKFTQEQCHLLLQKTGTVPLFISLGLSLLRSRLKDAGLNEGAIADSTLKQILKSLSGSDMAILRTMVTYFRSSPDLANCFEATVLLDGELPPDVIYLCCGGDPLQAGERLLETALFTAVGRKLVVRHNLIYDAMADTSSPIRKADIADKLLGRLKNNSNPLTKDHMQQYKLHFYACDYNKVLALEPMLIKQLKKENQYVAIIECAELALEAYEHSDFAARDRRCRAALLIDILFAHTQLHILSSPKIEKYIVMLETIINLNKWDPEYTEARLWYLWIRWYLSFYSGNINDSFEIISEAKTIIDRPEALDQTLCEQVYRAFGLSYKRETTLEEGIRVFKEGLEKYPGSTLLEATIILHEAHVHLRTNPALTAQMCREMLVKVENTDYFYREILQARVDIAMAAFYAGDYRMSLSEAQNDYEIARSNNIAYQEGRLLNIIAAVNLAQDNEKLAAANFKRSYDVFKTSGIALFQWRPLFNLAQIYLKTGRKNVAFKLFDRLLKYEIKNMSERLEHLTLMNSELVCILFMARIYQNERDDWQRKFDQFLKIPIFQECLNLAWDEFMEMLTNLSYVHSGFIVILG